MKLLENFAIPIPKEEAKIKALYEGLKGLGYKMFRADYSSYIKTHFSYLQRGSQTVGGIHAAIYSSTIFPSFEAFKEAHEALNRVDFKVESPKRHSHTEGFTDLEEFLEEYGLSFEDLMEEIYAVPYLASKGCVYFANKLLKLRVTKINHDQQGNNYTFEGTVINNFSNEEWEFEIVDGNGKGTEVINFEKTVDKEISKEDNTMARVSGGGGSYTYNPKSKELLSEYEKEYTLNIEDLPKHSDNIIPDLNKTKEKTMRRVVTVKLIDPNPAIEASDALVGDFGEYVTDDSNEVLIQEIIMEGDVQELLDTHNTYLTETLDQSILKSTGQKVMLRPIRLKDLKWIIKE